MKWAVVALMLLMMHSAWAQSGPNWPQGYRPQAPEWQHWWTSKQDAAAAGLSVDVRAEGAVCDGVTDDSAAFAAAFAFLPNGGRVIVPSTGSACLINHGQTLPPNVTLSGVAGHHWPGFDGLNPEAWATSGSFIQCGDLTNACLTINEPGSTIEHVNFIYAQPPPPTSGSWTPIAYPWTIQVNGGANFNAIENVSIVAGTNCIDWEGPPSGVEGINSHMEHVFFDGCFNTGTRFAKIDNTLSLNDLRYDNYWYQDRASVTAYIETHKVDWDVAYLANTQATNIEFFQSWRSIQLTDNAVTSGFGNITFAAANLQLANVSFNEVCQAIVPTSSTTHGSGNLSNVIVARDTSTNACPGAPAAMFDFSSNYANWGISNLSAAYVQTLADVGPTTGLRLDSVDVQLYSAFLTGGVAFGIASTGQLSLASTQMNAIRPASGAGPAQGCSIAYPSSCGVIWPVQSGPSGAGFVQLDNGNATYTGDVSFWSSSGVRNGIVGRASGTAMIIDSDAGNLALTAGATSGTGNITLSPNGGSGEVTITSSGGKTQFIISNPPTSCSGVPAGTLWNNAGVPGFC